jgi:hypothetical protein
MSTHPFILVFFIIIFRTSQQHTVIQGSRASSYYHDWRYTLQAQDGTSVHPIVIICRRIHGQWSMHNRLLETVTGNRNYFTYGEN